MNGKSKYMLPIGFYDLLGLEAEVNAESINILLSRFSSYGYNLIKPPLVEFEENWQKNPKFGGFSFKMIDVFSNKTLLIRSDITTQIARLANNKLKDEPLPMRLSYVGDVLKVKNNDLHADRQLTQVGIELIGSDSNLANLEVLNATLNGLEDIKVPNLLIDFCLPQFLNYVIAELKIVKSSELKYAILEKNISRIKEFGEKYADNLIKLTLPSSNIFEVSEQILKLPLSDTSKEKIKNLQKIVGFVEKNYSALSVSIDIFGDSDFSYHEDIAFTIFEINSSCIVAKGGRYRVNNKIAAVGATIYINNLRKILVKKTRDNKKKILIAKADKTKLLSFQSDGYITFSSMLEDCNEINLKIEAKNLGCNFMYFNDLIMEI